MAKGYCAKDYQFAPVSVQFICENKALQALYDRCASLCARNEADYGDKRVLREGSDYDGVWLETQPMGGEMYAKRNVEAALNNQLIFMENQRRSGRFPGMIKYGQPFLLQVSYSWLQGYCFPLPALKMAWLIGLDRGYLERLAQALEDFDGYLWEYRDSDGDGCLETWCTWDTGEDNCTRFLRNGVRDGGFTGEEPPRGVGALPIASMDVMSYSYTGRDVLARIAALLQNGREAEWRAKAEQVRAALRVKLWDSERSACFDRDSSGNVMDILLHNNLRCMYFGSFSQQMADDFIREHLANPNEFWTPLPLPSIAVSDPFYDGANFNNWSGPCMGLTYQRAIQALENYGHSTEIRLLGKKWLQNLCRCQKLVQQYDPFDGTPGVTRAEGGAPDDEKERFPDVGSVEADGYGPTILAALEYISLLYGVNIAEDSVRWTAVSSAFGATYTQNMHGHAYTLRSDGARMTAQLDGRALFSCTCGAQVTTGLDGTLREVVCVEPHAIEIALTAHGVDEVDFCQTIAPNCHIVFENGAQAGRRQMEFPERLRSEECGAIL